MRRYAVRDDQWDSIKHLLPGRDGPGCAMSSARHANPGARNFLDARHPFVRRMDQFNG